MIEVARREGPWLAALGLGTLVVAVALFLSPWLALASVPGLAVLGMLFLRPTLTLPFLLVALMVSDGLGLGITLVFPITLGKLSMLVVLATWFAHCMATQRWPVQVRTWWWPVLAFLVVLVVGLVYSRRIGGNGIELIVGYSTLTILMVVVQEVVDSRHLWHALRTMAWLWIAVVALSIPLGGSIEEFGNPRAFGFGVNPNEWAIMVVLGLGPTIAVLENEETWLGRWGTFLALGIGATAVFLTVSRAGIVALVATTPFVVYIMWRRRLMLVLAAIVLLVAVPALVDLENVWMRFDSFVDAGELELDGSVRDRGIAQRFALQAFWASPLIGIGTGGFLSEVEVASGGQVVKETHNTYLQVLAENGLFGMAIFLWLGGTVVVRTWRMWSQTSSPRFRRLVAGFASSVVAFALMIATMNGLTFTLAFFFLALLLALERISREPTEHLQRHGLA